MQIIVKTLNGVTIPLNVDQKDTIQQVKNKLFAKFGGVPPDLQDLMYETQILADSATLEKAYCRVAVEGKPSIEVHKNGTKQMYVVMTNGSMYRLCITNGFAVKCEMQLNIDGFEMGTWEMQPHEILELERPVKFSKQFAFYRVKHAQDADTNGGTLAPQNTGIVGNRVENGLIECVFRPHVIQDGMTNMIDFDLSMKMHDYHFEKQLTMMPIPPQSILCMALRHVAILPNPEKIKHRRGGRCNYRKSGQNGAKKESKCKKAAAAEDDDDEEVQGPQQEEECKSTWVAGATTLQGTSQQEFQTVMTRIPLSTKEVQIVWLRLVANNDDNENVSQIDLTTLCTPLRMVAPDPVKD